MPDVSAVTEPSPEAPCAALAIEARYRGAFIDARQITAAGPRRSAAPAAFFAGGITLVLVALALFFAGVHASAADAEALRLHLARGGGHGSFTAPARSSASDVLALLAAAGGVALVGAGFWRRGERRGRYVLGASAGADAPVAPEYVDGRSFAVVEARAEDCVVNVTPWMRGEVMLTPQVAVPLPLWVRERGASFALPAGSQARLVCGELELVVSPTARPRSLRPPLLAVAWREQQYTAATAVGLLAGLMVVAMVPPDARALSLDELGGHTRFAISNIMPPEPKELPKLPGQDGGGSASQAHKDPEGAMGKQRPKQPNGRLAIAGTARQQQLASARPVTAADIRSTGALAVLTAAEGGFLANVLGTRTLGADEQNVLGGLNRNPIGEAIGIEGMGVRGMLRGGGGDSDATVGDARFNTIGLGCQGSDCGGDPYGYGGKVGHLGTRRPGPVAIAIPGDPVTRGTLDKEIIRRVIRQHINEVKYCYEKQLVRDPALNGKVAVSFTIAGSGEVAASLLASSTMGNKHVEGCIVEAVRRWRFPSPQNNGIVIATYPFSFAPAGR